MAATLGDDILAEILIRLPTLADLGRASAACAAFRRVIAEPAFLRRVHALHPPSLLGFDTTAGGFHPVEPPHPSAPAARALERAADFSFSFLPGSDSGCCWLVRDARGGRFVLDRAADPRYDNAVSKTIAVCEPLFRTHVLLPHIPRRLGAGVRHRHRASHVFLAPCSEREAAERSFRVIWIAECPDKLVALVFSSAYNQWQAIASPSWDDLNPAATPAVLMRTRCHLEYRNYAYGCFYWSMPVAPPAPQLRHTSLVVLDTGRMEIFSIDAPDGLYLQEFAVSELGESRLGLFVHSYRNPELRLFCADWQNHGGDATHWEAEVKVQLPDDKSKYDILGVADGQLLLQKQREYRCAPMSGCRSLDLSTFQLQRVRGMLLGGRWCQTQMV